MIYKEAADGKSAVGGFVLSCKVRSLVSNRQNLY